MSDSILPAELSVLTDQSDYAPGETVTITVNNVTEGGTVTVAIVDSAADPGDDGDADVYPEFTATDGGAGDADGTVNGKIVTTWTVPTTGDPVNATLDLVVTDWGADGAQGGTDDRTATTTFTDAPPATYYEPLDFVAAEPTSYDHSTGGGAYNDRTINSDVVESLEGGDFVCGDIVTFFVRVAREDTGGPGAETIELDFKFLADSTGQSGVGFTDIVNVQISSGDSGNVDDGGSTATLISESLVGTPFTMGAELLGTVQVTDVEQGESIIVRIDVRIDCDNDPQTSPTGNLQAQITDARVVSPTPIGINTGNQTVPLMSVGDIVEPGDPRINVTKEADVECVDTAGQVITYTIKVENTGDVALTNVTIDDPLLDNEAAILVGGYNIGDLNLNNLLDVDETWCFQGSYEVTQYDLDYRGGGDCEINNYVNASAFTVCDDGCDEKVDSRTVVPDCESQEVTDTAYELVCIEVKPGIEVTKEADVDYVDEAGDIIKYTIKVANSGNVALTSVAIDDPLLDDEAAVLSGGYNVGDTNQNNLLDVDETWCYEGSYEVTQHDLDTRAGGDCKIENYVDASAYTLTVNGKDNVALLSEVPDCDKCGPEEVTDRAYEDVYVKVNPGIEVTKEADVDCVDKAGDIIKYTIKVANTGSVALTSVSIDDPLLDNEAAVLSGGYNVGDKNQNDLLDIDETWCYEGSYTVTQYDLDKRGGGDCKIDNYVYASAYTLGDPVKDEIGVQSVKPDCEDKCEPEQVTDYAYESVKLKINPGIDIDKKVINVVGGYKNANGKWVADTAGDVINYQFVIKNTGNVALSNVKVTDHFENKAGVTLSNATVIGDKDKDGLLDVGETWIYKAKHVVTASELAAARKYVTEVKKIGWFTCLVKKTTGDLDLDNFAKVTANVADYCDYDEEASTANAGAQPDYCDYPKTVYDADFETVRVSSVCPPKTPYSPWGNSIAEILWNQYKQGALT